MAFKLPSPGLAEPVGEVGLRLWLGEGGDVMDEFAPEAVESVILDPKVEVEVRSILGCCC